MIIIKIIKEKMEVPIPIGGEKWITAAAAAGSSSYHPILRQCVC